MQHESPVTLRATANCFDGSTGRVGELTDRQWQLVSFTIWGPQAASCKAKRQCIDAIIHLCNSGCRWRDLPPEFGKWNTVYVRCRRWGASGVLDVLLESLATVSALPRAAQCSVTTGVLLVDIHGLRERDALRQAILLEARRLRDRRPSAGSWQTFTIRRLFDVLN